MVWWGGVEWGCAVARHLSVCLSRNNNETIPPHVVCVHTQFDNVVMHDMRTAILRRTVTSFHGEKGTASVQVSISLLPCGVS